VVAGDVVAYMGLVNPLAVGQNVEIELLPEAGARKTFSVFMPAKSRKGVELTGQLPGTASFGALVHFEQQGIASLTLRRLSDFFGASALTVPGQVFCRELAQ
jgi:hypothetical protein